MPSPAHPASLCHGVFHGPSAVAAGHLSVRSLRSRAWRRLYRGVYVDATVADSVAVRIEGAALLLPPSAAFSGRTAAWLHGATELADLRAPVEVTVPESVSFGPVTGLRIRHTGLPERDTTHAAGQRCTTSARTAVDLVRVEPLIEGVVALDVMLRHGIVDTAQVRAALVGLPSPRGAARAREALRLADGRAESQPESRVRVRLALGGLLPVPQYVVRDAGGQFVARVDLAFPEHRIAVEYDGAWHAETGQFAADRRRLNRLVEAGWTVIHVTAADLHEPAALVARVREALRRATSGK